MELKTADLCDRYHSELQISDIAFVSYGGKRRFSGPIATLQVYEDNVLVRTAIETLPRGTVLIVDGGGSRRCALLGDNLAALAVKGGLAGVIVYGCIRDAAEIAELELGVLAIGSMPLKSKKEGKGTLGTVLQFGGIVWTPGDYVYADEDGVVVAPRQLEL